MKLLIDCSFISTTKLNTGIQRVVRQVIENIYDVAKNTPFEPYEVLLKDGKLEEISLTNKKTSLQKNIPIAKGDILLLLDSTWHLDIWQSVQNAKANGAIVIAVIYDIIPITHAKYCDASLVTLFNNWFSNAIVHVDGFITISQSVQNDLYHYLTTQYPQEQVAKKFFDYFHLGADFKYKAFHLQSKNIRQPLRNLYAHNKNIYLTVSTLEPRKNHAYLLDVFDRLWEDGYDVTLNIVGRVGWMVDDLIERIQTHKNYNKKLFHWDNLNDEELNYCYKNSKMLLFSSFAEGFGLAIIESLANNLAVLASDIAVHREIGKENIGYFDLNSVDDLTEQIKNIQDKGIPKQLQVSKNFQWLSWHQSTQMLLNKIKKHYKKTYNNIKKIEKIEKHKHPITLKEKIKSLPLLGWLLRWGYNLLRLNNIKHILFHNQTQIAQLHARLLQHQETFTQQQNQINQHQEAITQQQNQINQHQEAITQQQNQIEQQQESIAQLHAHLLQQQETIKQQQNQIEQLLQDNATHNNLYNQLTQIIQQEVTKEITYTADTLQQRIDQFLFDAKIELRHDKL